MKVGGSARSPCGGRGHENRKEHRGCRCRGGLVLRERFRGAGGVGLLAGERSRRRQGPRSANADDGRRAQMPRLWTRDARGLQPLCRRSEEHTSELQSLMRISYAVFCLEKNKTQNKMTQKR